MADIPQKEAYKLSEVCRYTDTQPYVLRFWESEFPQLTAGKPESPRVYTRQDLDLIQRIKQLLHEEKCTLAGARKRLEDEAGKPGRKSSRRKARGAETAKAEAPSSAPRRANEPAAEPHAPVAVTPVASGSGRDAVSRQRYEDAIDEIGHLRLQVKEAEKAQRKAEGTLEEARQELETCSERSNRATARLESLLEALE